VENSPKDPRIVQVMAGLAEYDVVMVARRRHAGADVRPMVRLSVTVIAEQKAAEVGSSGRWRPLWFQLL
jgi:TldD protein